YLRSDRNLLSAYLGLRALIGKRDLRWRLGELDPLRSALRVLLLAAYLLCAARLCSDRLARLALVLSSLPWLFLVALAAFPALLAFFLVIPAWAYLFERIHASRYRGPLFEKSPGAPLLRPLLTAAAAVLLAVALNRPGPCGGLLLAAAGGLPAAAFLYAALLLRDDRAAHSPFRLLPILRRFRLRRPALFPSLTPFVVMASIVLCSHPALRLAAGLTAEPPETIRMQSIGNDEQGLSWRSLSELWEYSDSRDYPDLADYLTHRAFQESLMFARPYEFPRAGERILVSDYRVAADGARVHKTFRVVKQFKDSWLEETLEAAGPGSVPRLFADQGFAGTVELRAAAQGAGGRWAVLVLVVLYLLQFLVPRYFNLTASALYATRSLTLRRH
ncbi:MAG: hypothetical protein JXB06_04365, partial [Spirochaetales bacterium]|nr:hypothetical protein [Spirochaetales bacterium]